MRNRIDSGAVRVESKQAEPAEVDADLLVVGLHQDAELPAALADAPGAGDARGGYKKTALIHPEK